MELRELAGRAKPSRFLRGLPRGRLWGGESSGSRTLRGRPLPSRWLGLLAGNSLEHRGEWPVSGGPEGCGGRGGCGGCRAAGPRCGVPAGIVVEVGVVVDRSGSWPWSWDLWWKVPSVEIAGLNSWPPAAWNEVTRLADGSCVSHCVGRGG